MKSFSGLALVASAALAGAAKFSESEYDTGAVHEALMAKKFVSVYCNGSRVALTGLGNMGPTTCRGCFRRRAVYFGGREGRVC